MFTDLKVFQISGAMAAYAGHRQAVLAQNVANADTPGYHARDLVSFSTAYAQGARSFTQRATRPSHLNGVAAPGDNAQVFDRPAAADPNGNTVQLEQELMLAADARRQHDRALAVYRSALDILRASIRVR